jgi:hypothetical protein
MCISLDIGPLRSQVGTPRRETQTNNDQLCIESEWILTAKTRKTENGSKQGKNCTSAYLFDSNHIHRA